MGHAIGGLARRVANLQGFGCTVKKVLQLSLVPSNLYRLVGLVRLSLAIARQLKHHIGATQTVDVVTGVVVGVDVEERHIAVGLILSVGDADRGLGILCLKEHAALRDLDVDIGKSQIGKLRLQNIVDVAALGAVINSDLFIGIVELLGCGLKRACGDHGIGRDELDRRVAARGDSLQILASSRCRDRRLGARHIGQQRPVGLRSLRVVGRIPGNSRLVGDIDTVGGRTVGALGLRRRLNAIARDEMSRIAINLRSGDHTQQVILPRRGNAVRRYPLNRVVESTRRNLDLLADKRIRKSQAAIGLIDAVGELGPIGIALALGIPRHGELGIVGHVRGRARPTTRNLHARCDLRAHAQRNVLIGKLNACQLVLALKRHGAERGNGLRAAVGALLLSAGNGIFARHLHAQILAGIGSVNGIGGLGSTGDIGIGGVIARTGICILPLIGHIVGAVDIAVARTVLFAHLSLERIAYVHAIGGGRALKLYVIELHLARDGNGTRRIVGLLLAIAAVGLSHNVAALKGGGHRQGVTGLTLDRRVARACGVRGALIPLPRDM